jgi:hypothetical protein
VQSFIIDFLTIFLDLDEIDTLEGDDVWGNEQGVDGHHGDQEVPNFAECPFCIDEIPFELWLGVDDLVLLISVFVDIVDHHFLEVRLGHFLKTSLESTLVVVTSGFAPPLLDSFLLLLWSHVFPLFLGVIKTHFRLAFVTKAAQDIGHDATVVVILVVRLVLFSLTSTLVHHVIVTQLWHHGQYLELLW